MSLPDFSFDLKKSDLRLTLKLKPEGHDVTVSHMHTVAVSDIRGEIQSQVVNLNSVRWFHPQFIIIFCSQTGRPSVGSGFSESVLVEKESTSSSQSALGAPVIPQAGGTPSAPPPTTTSKVSDL